jgi:hypothetical protein
MADDVKRNPESPDGSYESPNQRHDDNHRRPSSSVPRTSYEQGTAVSREGKSNARAAVTRQASSTSAPDPNGLKLPIRVPIRETAAKAWKTIGEEFVVNRAFSKHKAFKQLQLAIMQNCDILSPDYLSPKDVVALAMDVEKFLKDNPEATGDDRTNIDLISDWLNGDSELNINIPDSHHRTV